MLEEGVESKGKEEKLKHPKRSDKSSLWHVLRGHQDLIVAFLKVQPRENSLTSNCLSKSAIFGNGFLSRIGMFFNGW